MKFIGARRIFAYLTGDDPLDKMIIYESSKHDLYTFDQSLYEALGSAKNDVNMNKLVKFLEVVDIMPFRKVTNSSRTLLTDDRIRSITGR